MDYLKSQIDDLEKQIEDSKKLFSDPELASLAKAEVEKLEEQKKVLSEALTSDNPTSASTNVDNHNSIVEIRAAAGGDEAGLFAGVLYRMYTRFAAVKNWKVEQLSINEGGIGNIKEVVFKVNGRGAYGLLKFESGVHRVQRVPETESSGRIHTSTVTVAVLPELQDRDFHINDSDVKVDTFHASGHGGQNVQKVETAVRLTHIPTGTIATCQTERSQFQNRTKALDILRARVYEAETAKAQAEVASDRKLQVGTGDRSEKIRTYNYPQDRITDHRIGESWHNIQNILDGNLNDLLGDLKKASENPTSET